MDFSRNVDMDLIRWYCMLACRPLVWRYLQHDQLLFNVGNFPHGICVVVYVSCIQTIGITQHTMTKA